MAKTGDNAGDPVPLNDQGRDHVLVEVYVGGLFEHFAPGGGKEHTVVLGPRAPHGGAFGAVEHAKLDHAFVASDPGVPPHSVDFPDDLAFGDAAHGRVATHLGDRLQVHGDEKDFGAEVCGSRGCFAAGMSGTYHYYVVFGKHDAKLP